MSGWFRIHRWGIGFIFFFDIRRHISHPESRRTLTSLIRSSGQSFWVGFVMMVVFDGDGWAMYLLLSLFVSLKFAMTREGIPGEYAMCRCPHSESHQWPPHELKVFNVECTKQASWYKYSGDHQLILQQDSPTTFTTYFVIHTAPSTPASLIVRKWNPHNLWIAN